MPDAIRSLHELFNNYLKPLGWDRSLDTAPVDANGAPLPWITYPAMAVLAQIVKNSHRVFEFGCGNSSHWWAGKAKEVVSVEHDGKWIEQVAKTRPANITVIHRPRGAAPTTVPTAAIAAAIELMAAEQVLSDDDYHNEVHGLNIRDFTGYATALTEWPQSYFDIIVVDGMARSLCAYLAGLWVKPHGIVVFDNTERWQYSNGLEALRDLGFGRIDFFGAVPGKLGGSCTSIFVRSTIPFLTIPPREIMKSDIHSPSGYSKKIIRPAQ